MQPDIESQFYEYLDARNYASRAASVEHLRTYLAHFGSGERILDVGCGRGEFLELLSGKGCHAEGVDLDPGMVEACHGKGLTVHKMDAFAFLRSSPVAYDGIFASNFVEHFPPPQVVEFFQLAHGALRPGGRLLVAVPNPESAIVHLYEFWRDATHVRLYNRQLVEFLLVYCGFEVVATGENEAAHWQPDLADIHPPEIEIPDLAVPAQPLIARAAATSASSLSDAAGPHAPQAPLALSDPIVYPLFPAETPQAPAPAASNPKRGVFRGAVAWLRDQVDRVLVDPVVSRHLVEVRETTLRQEREDKLISNFLSSLMPVIQEASQRTRHDTQALATSLALAHEEAARLEKVQRQLAKCLSLLEVDLGQLQKGLERAGEGQAQLGSAARQIEENARAIVATMSSLRASLLFLYPSREVYVLGRRRETG